MYVTYVVCGRSRGGGPTNFGRMGAAGCMLKVSHTLAARGCVRLIF